MLKIWKASPRQLVNDRIELIQDGERLGERSLLAALGVVLPLRVAQWRVVLSYFAFVSPGIPLSSAHGLAIRSSDL